LTNEYNNDSVKHHILFYIENNYPGLPTLRPTMVIRSSTWYELIQSTHPLHSI